MEAIIRWAKHSSPLVKMTMAIAVTSAIVVGQKMFYTPYVRRRRLQQAEEWANYIIEQEEGIEEFEKS